MKTIEARITALMHAFETAPLGFWAWAFLFASIVCIRNTLEAFSGLPYIADFPNFFPHFFLAYLDPLLALVLTLSWLSGEKIARVSRLMLACWLLTLLPPLVDIAVSKGEGAMIAYAPLGLGAAWPVYLHLFNPFRELAGTTVGIRVETLVACVLGGYYVYLKRRRISLALVTALAVYLISVSFFNLPNLYLELSHLLLPEIGTHEQLYSATTLLGPSLNRVPYAISLADLTLAGLLALAWLRRWDRREHRALFRARGVVTASLLGALGWIGAAYGGLEHAWFESGDAHPLDLLRWAAVFLSIFSAGLLYAAMRRDADRPSPSVLAAVAMGSISFAGLVGYSTLTLALTLSGLVLIARMPPWHLSERRIIGRLPLAATVPASFVLGYSLFARDFAAVAVPRDTVLFLLGASFVLLVLGEEAARRAPRSTWLRREAGPLLAIAVAGSSVVWLPIVKPELATDALGLDHLYRGKIFSRNRDHAAIEYRRAVAKGVREPDVYQELVELHAQRGEVDAIVTLVDEAADRLATSPDFFLEAGNALMRVGDFERAALIFERGTTAHPRSHRLANNVAYCYDALGRTEDAAAWYRRAVRIEPDPASVQNLAVVYYKLGKYEESERQYRRILETEPRHLGALKSLTFLWIEKLGDPDKAREFGTRFLTAGPDEAEARLVAEKLAELPER